MKIIRKFIFVILLVTSCSPSPEVHPTKTAGSWTPTPEPTAIPAPEPITGKLFWDANGSGLQDETSFIVPEYDPEDPPYFFELLAAQGSAIEEFVPGELATVPEPDILGMKVCVGDVCTETDENGEFNLQPEKYQITYNLAFEDPNEGDPEKEFRYINEWKGEVVIEVYEVDGVIVPEHHLNDTEVLELDRGFSIAYDPENTIGLIQGFLTMMYSEKNPYEVSCWYDHDDEFGSFLNFLGNKNPYNNPAEVVVSGDNHDGTDFDVPDNTYVFSLAEGKVNFADEIPNDRGYGPVLHTTIDHLNRKYASGTGHHSVLLVNRDDEIYRGQIVALSGHSGTSGSHIHLSAHYYEKGVSPPPTMDPYGTLFDNENYYEKQSWWTVYNVPQFPLVEVVE